jgi:hypothetical protein
LDAEEQSRILAAELKNLRQAGFHFSKTQTRHFCGRLLLARLPQARNTTERQSLILEK